MNAAESLTPLAARLARCAQQDFLSALTIAPGGLDDYRRLAAYHYKAHLPATATRVLVMRYPSEDLGARFARIGQPSAATANPSDHLIVGVLVESLPGLSCAMREHALQGRYTNLPDTTSRAAMLNREVRCISRVVIHPCWRGLGLAVALVKASLASPMTRFTEALAAMGRVNPFFAKAGMRAYPRPSHEYDLRFMAVLKQIGLSAIDLSMLDRCRQIVAALDEEQRRWFAWELIRWHKRNGGRAASRRGINNPELAWKAAQERLLAEPVYYLHDNLT